MALPLAEKLRELFLHQGMDRVDGGACWCLPPAATTCARCIEPALARGAVVLCDRFTDATFAYQGAGRGFDVAAILAQLETWVQGEAASPT